ncbi:MAG: hypothetical protein KIT84_19925 [Labilithrix sp.]|nr:hypothetical protein [Labilithrix sp.]MCW5813307.1 hypothetical protein [Labilithrix sp.]
MDATDPFVTRHGLRPKRSRGGTWLFLFGIGALVAGLGVAGLYFGRPERWDHRAAPSEAATPAATAELTSAETETETRPATLTIGDDPAAEPTAAPPPPPVKQRPPPPPKKPPPPPEPTPEPEADPFSTVH